MLRIKVKYFGKVKTVTNRLEEEISTTCRTIEELLIYLSNLYGDKFSNIIFKNNRLADDIIILINGKSIGSDTKKSIRYGDTISILPFISGG